MVTYKLDIPMKRTIFLLTAIAGAAMLQSCIFQRPVANMVPANNKTYNVSYLFEHDGCKVYRFYDQGHWVYFTNCKGDVTSISADSTHTRVVNNVRTNP